MIPKVLASRCAGCGECFERCPVDAIDLGSGIARIDEEFCEECGVCLRACPREAIIIDFPTSGRDRAS